MQNPTNKSSIWHDSKHQPDFDQNHYAQPTSPVDMYLFCTNIRLQATQMDASDTKVIRQHERVLSGLGAISTPLAHHARTRPVTLKPYTCWDPVDETRISPQTPESVGTIIILFPLSILGNWGKTCGDAVLAVAIKVSLALCRPNMNPWKS